MGICRCELHGYGGFYEVCPHIGAALKRGALLPRRELLGVSVCDDCVERYDLARFAGAAFPRWSEAASTAYDALNARSAIWCAECLAAVELRFARARGLPDPFPAYERTLTWLQRDTIDRLEEGLLAAFSFRESVVEPGKPALHLSYGALTHPLELTIYSVLDPAEQSAILAWLARFHEGIEQSQYRVRFLRAESWNPDPEGGWSRGPEELLREYEADPP